MNKNNYQIAIERAQDGKPPEIVLIQASRGEPVRLQTQPGAVYTLSDKSTDKAPQQIFARRQGKNLLLQLDVQRPGEGPDLILEGFYDGAPAQVVGLAEDGNIYRFVPNSAAEFDQLGLIADGAVSSQVLGGAAFAGAAAAPMAVAAAPLVAAGGFALGPLGMAAAGVGGALALAGGGGGGGGGNTGATPATSFRAALAAGEDTGSNTSDNITNKSQPRLGGTVTPGSTVAIKVGNQAEVFVTPDALGNWSWTPTTPLPEGQTTITFTPVDANNSRGTPQSITLTVDTGHLKAAYTSNFEQLNTEPLGALDTKLNAKEGKDGILVTLSFEEAAERDLNRDDLNLTGGSILNFNKVPNLNQYQMLIQPSSNTAGQLLLQWTNKGKTLKDLAGNPLDNLNLQWRQDYDTAAPDVTLYSGQEEVDYTIGEDLSIAWVPKTPLTDLASITVSLLGQTARKTSALADTELRSSNGLNGFKEGYYSLNTTFTDTAGNTTVFKNRLVVDRGDLEEDAWNSSRGNTQVGTEQVDLFINIPGNQTITGGPTRDSGASDFYVWLSNQAGGQAGTPDIDTITDFSLEPLGAQGDSLDIKDLLGLGTASLPVNAANLPRFVQVSTYDTDGNNTPDSTRVSISRAGGFGGTASIASVADQVILLPGVVASTLNDLLPNLDWQATGSVILA